MVKTPHHLPTVDIAIPNYNYGHYLLECANSVLSQTGVAVRLLIIDNASTDNSAALARTLAANDLRVELLLRPENLGPHASFNQAIDWARSEFFLILCADDLLSPGALARSAQLLQQCPDVHLAFGVAQSISEQERPPQKRAFVHGGDWDIVEGKRFIECACRHAFNPVAGPTALVRTEIQKRVGYYRPQLPHTDDLEMWLRFAIWGNVASTRDVQAFARVHTANQSAQVAGIMNWNREFEAAFRSFFEQEGREIAGASGYLEAARNCLTKRAYWSAFSSFLRGEKGAARLMAFALKRRPLLALLPPLDYLLERRHRHN
ncbi:glycosyltransferase [Ochrobactrum sp. AN78]|uniref:glycosyltransferase n=1 Tax=Ochrobactrum sp. AN78 TaxID=3039853 RepID=UPI002989E5E5|nr:glycosyltransferase [Ochrobactrum sp. AN78]MDH7793426.1 glycosyltransferase involved in cell wall biosynthesis [Ochrobactrum sp. AN78]